MGAIFQRIDQHNSGRPFPAAEVRMNPFEVERLGLGRDPRGCPWSPMPRSAPAGFASSAPRDLDGAGIEETEAIGEPVEVGAPVEVPVPVRTGDPS